MEGFIVIILTWLLLGLVFSGLGALAVRAFGLRLQRIETWFLAFWTGFGVVILILQLWHFLYPVNNTIRVIIGMGGVAGIVWNARDLWDVLRRGSRQGRLLVVFLVMFTFWIANRSIGEPVIYETGLYHINAVQWFTTYPVVPGLGNLHSRLGFSNAFFLYPALYNVGYWLDRTYHIANGLLFWVLGAQISLSGYVLLRKRQLDLYHTFQAMFFPVVWLLLLSETIIPSMANDPPTFALGVVIAGQALNVIQNKNFTNRQTFYRLFFIVLVSAVGAAIKFSFVVMGALLSFIVLFIWVKRYTRWRFAPVQRAVLFLGVVTALVLIPMMGRSVMMTGYPLYPITAAPFDVDWRIYPEHGKLEYDFIQSFARVRGTHPYQIDENWNWFPLWLDARFNPRLFRDHFYFSFAFFTTITSIVLIIFNEAWCRYKKRSSRRVNPWLWVFLLPATAAIVFWFISAPAPRFAGAALWTFAFGWVLVLVHKLAWWSRRWHIYATLLLILAVMAIPFTREVVNFWVMPSGNIDGMYTVPKPFIKQYTTDYGLVINYPPFNNQCWGAPIPCTPYPHHQMRLRVPGDISQGFWLILDEDDIRQVVE